MHMGVVSYLFVCWLLEVPLIKSIGVESVVL